MTFVHLKQEVDVQFLDNEIKMNVGYYKLGLTLKRNSFAILTKMNYPKTLYWRSYL